MSNDSLSPQASEPKPREENRGAFSRLLMGLGAAVCLLLAVLGFVLPLLPCTPFLLLASFLLVRCSPEMHRRLRESRYFGRILADWEDRGGIRPRDKVRAILVIVSSVVLTFWLGNVSAWMRAALIVLVAVGLFVIIRLPEARA